MKAIGILALLLAPAMWAQTCPSITFVGPADLALVGRTNGQGFAGGLSRQEDGSFTLRRFSGFATNFTQTNTPQFQQNIYGCIGLPPRPTPMRPPGYMHGADEVGVQSRNPVFTKLGTAGTIAGIGFGPYSTSNTQLTVWQANGTTPGTRANHAILTDPEGLLVADFNGDGRKDVAVLSQRNFNETGRVQLFPGNADGTLGARIDSATGQAPSSMAAFDFNGDNKLDLVVGHFNTSGLMLLLGNGDGTFQAATTIGPSGKAVAVADLNKDGKADLVVGRNDGLDIRLGNGNGTFQAASRIRIGVNYTYVAAGDFNKDGNPDIAAAGIDGIVSVYLGNGAGAFPTSNTYLTRDNAEYMILVDFDWDGNLDVVFAGGHPDGLVVQPYDHNLTVLFGRGDGTLHAASSYDSVGGVSAVAIGDLNGDGRPDLVTTRVAGQGSNVGPLINTGSGRFEPAALMTFSFQSQTWTLASVDVADINGDGRADIIAGGSGRVFTALGNGNGTFQAPSSFAAGSDITSLLARDFNGDNRADIAFTSTSSDQVFVALGNGTGTFGNANPITVGKRPLHLGIADLNGDGRLDLIVTNGGQIAATSIAGSVSVLSGAGNGTFAPPVNIAAGMFPTATTVADANGDGRLDLVVATQGANFAYQVQVHAGRGDGTFLTPTILPVDFGPGPVGVADFDGDSKIDLIVPHCCGDTSLGILVGNGNGAFQAEVLRPAGIGQLGLQVRDLTGDNRPDVVFVSSGFSGGAGVAVFLNVSGGAVIDDCAFTTNRTGATASALGDTLGVTVTASQSSCSWNATSDQAWVTFGGTLPRTGTGALRMTVAANPGALRTANVTVAGRAFTITQAAAGCGFTIDPLSQSVPGAGGPFTFNVATQAGCAWSPLSSQSFLTITQGAGAMGPGQAGYSVAANAAAARTASVSVAGEIQQVVQAAANPSQQFNDVPVTHPFYHFISIMRDRGITAGCNASNYCPDTNTTRGQMAVFIVRALFGGDNFPFNSTPFFTDVPSTHPFFRWIQKMRELGVTSGCTATTYCPDGAVTRGQMAAFIIRARLGLAAGDPLAIPLGPYFSDVTATHPFFTFIQKMRQLAVTSGCTAVNYCPESETSRGQMSVFIVRGLLTP